MTIVPFLQAGHRDRSTPVSSSRNSGDTILIFHRVLGSGMTIDSAEKPRFMIREYALSQAKILRQMNYHCNGLLRLYRVSSLVAFRRLAGPLGSSERPLGLRTV